MTYLYEIIDTEADERLTPVPVTGKEAAEILKCAQSTVLGAYFANHLVKHRYRIQPVDTVIPRKDSIWLDWELRRTWLLRICSSKHKNDRIGQKGIKNELCKE